jgi:hypothetical protein
LNDTEDTSTIEINNTEDTRTNGMILKIHAQLNWNDTEDTCITKLE